MITLSQYRKFLAAFAGVVAQVVAANVLTGSELHYVQVIAATVSALLVVTVPNAPA